MSKNFGWIHVPSFKCRFCGEFTPYGDRQNPQICCECGKPQVNQCPVCDKEISIVEKYCGSCWEKLNMGSEDE